MSEILIADAALDDLDDLLSGLRPGVVTIRVAKTDNAQAILADILAARPAAVHLLAHGAPGRIELGARPIDAASLADRSWPDAAGTEILIHACRVAEGEAGRRFIDTLAAATGARVAAASHPVGHADLGGSWQLDALTAPALLGIKAAQPFAVPETWRHVLATFTGTAGNDTLTGGAENDSLIGGAGNDTLSGGAGNDTLNGGPGADALNGGADFDSATYETATSGLVLDLANPANSTGEAAGDTFIDIERWIGSNFNDTLIAGDQPVWFWAHDGDDLERGGAGNDTLEAGNGNDTIYGGGGDDQLFGRAGVDVLYGEAGNDLLAGGGGEDAMDGGAGNDTLIGDWDADTLTGGDGDDVFYSGEHTFEGTAQDQADVISGGNGNDVFIIAGQSDAGTVTYGGGAGTDTLRISSVVVHDTEETIYQTPKAATAATPAIDISQMTLSSVENLDLVGSAHHTVTMTAAQANMFTSITGATVGDTFKVVGTSMSGTVSAGNGSTLTAGQVQAETVNGVTLLHVGVDNTAGSDVTLSFAGSFTADQFQVSGNTVTLVQGGTTPTTPTDPTTPTTPTTPTDPTTPTTPTTPTDPTTPTTPTTPTDPTTPTTPTTPTDPTTPTTPTTPMFDRTVGGVSDQVAATAYSGPVTGLQWQFLGTSADEAVNGSSGNDFINLGAGNDAINAGGGDDVLDGGTGSNFLSGGAGNDTFFVDGRGGGVTWSTVTDLEKGEWATIWGFKDGTSTLTWQDMAGADGFKGATAFCDLDGNGSIDASMTFTGVSAAQLTNATGTMGDAAYLAITLK